LPGTELYGMVGVEIEPSQYALLNWNGSEMTSTLNKSGIEDIVRVHHALKKHYLFRSIFHVVFNWSSMRWFLSKNNKWKRLKVALGFLFSELRKCAFSASFYQGDLAKINPRKGEGRKAADFSG